MLILDVETGRIQHPVCWQDLLAYYNYLMGRGRVDESQMLLAESIAGNKPITAGAYVRHWRINRAENYEPEVMG